MLRPAPSLMALAISTALYSNISLADEAPQSAKEELEVIVVSGTKTEKALKDVSGSISVVTAEDIDKQVITDLSQLFQYDPSVQVTGTDGQAQNIVVRGMGGDRVLIIKDGMRVNEGYGADGLNDIVGRGFIETDNLKQVEVAKGAYSSLYGADALGGIVVFETKDASDYVAEGDTFGGNASIGYASNSKQKNASVTLAHNAGDFEHYINIVKRDGEESQNFDETKKPLDIESTSVFYKAAYELNHKNKLAFSADIWNQDVGALTADGLLGPFRSLANFGYNIVSENAKTEREAQAFQLRFMSHETTALYDYLSVNLYSNHTQQQDIEFGALDINAPMFGVKEKRDMWRTGNYEQQTFGLLTSANKALDDTHVLGFGIDIETTESQRTVRDYREYHRESGDTSTYVTEDKFPKNDTLRVGAYLNDEISLLSDKLIVTPSIRFDYYNMDPNGALKPDGTTKFKSISDNNVSLNLGALYKLNDDVSVYAQYGQGFKVPAYDLAYIEHDNSQYGYKVISSDDLSPEKSDTYEIGLKGSFGDLAVTTALYYNKYDDFLATEVVKIEEVPNPFDPANPSELITYQYANIDSVTIKGAELGLTYYFSDELNIFANASYQHGKDDTTGEYLTSISPLSGVAGISYDMENLTSQLIVNWADRMTKVNKGHTVTAGYATVDFQIGYQFSENLALNLSAKNLFDKEYVRFNNVVGHDEGSDLSYNTSPGRNFNAKLVYKF
ncbi:TonB-dependent hemoglobin/transferrin/lactoferrin family receptor [Shewanella sp. OPT22]|nr:TonB-dependent hemoglobin/transferrin/lactoferrin family receptor [Shewanella sp. OPT22]